MKQTFNRFGFALVLLLLAVPALAQDATKAGDTHSALAMVGGFGALAAGIAMGIAALGGTLGQGRAAAAALEGISRNPAASGTIFLPFILSLVFMESLVLFTFAIAFFLQGFAGSALKALGVG